MSAIIKGMQVFFLLLILLVFCSKASSHTTKNLQHILYVKSSNKPQCPADVQFTECQTLDWYGENFNASFLSNAKMLFEDGEHKLKKTIAIDNCHNFVMTENGSAGTFNDGLPQPTTTVHCDRNPVLDFSF